MLFDFHTHTFLSDGVLSPIELMRRAASNGYTAMAVTDHAGINDQERVLEILVKECAEATENMGLTVVPGVELTHVPPHRIGEAARRAKANGARIVLVHGETIKEPVAKGTNRAALESPDVDILVHPGMITEEEADIARQAGIYLGAFRPSRPQPHQRPRRAHGDGRRREPCRGLRRSRSRRPAHRGACQTDCHRCRADGRGVHLDFGDEPHGPARQSVGLVCTTDAPCFFRAPASSWATGRNVPPAFPLVWSVCRGALQLQCNLTFLATGVY